MKGWQFKEIRLRLGLSRDQMAIYLGYTGSHKTHYSTMQKFEDGLKIIPPYIARLMFLIDHLQCGRSGLPQWPNWPAYKEDEHAN